MKKIVSLAGVLMVLAAGSAMASGINMSWDDCGSTVQAKNIATCTNSATLVENLYVSFKLAAPIPLVGAADGNVDVQSPNTLGSWWLGGSARFGASTGPSSCVGWYDAAAGGGVIVGPGISQTSPSRLRLRVVVAVQTGAEVALPRTSLLEDLTTEYFTHAIILKRGTGTFNNPECLAGAAFAATHLLLQQPGSGLPTEMSTPDVDNCCTFRLAGGLTCPSATPTQKATWGSIKALYR